MTAFPALTRVTGRAAPLIRPNVDTDAIIPSREIKGVAKTGLSEGLFAGWRYIECTREPNPNFVLNDPVFANAPILLGGDNFGCGSSREHAVWALHEYGVRAIIAPSFAPIFANNCIRNGIVPVVLEAQLIDQLGDDVSVDLATQTVSSGACSFSFEIDSQAKLMLMEGLDAIDLTMKEHSAITAFLERDRTERPWVYL
jgi:3-isopropylmalate/(R)-2-methylmalate dehydratase small subunit